MNTGSSIFLIVGASLFLVLFGLPLLIRPMDWARRIGWTVPEETDLAEYLGRSLGGVIIAVILTAYIAAIKPWTYRIIFELVIWIGIAMVFVHLYGFIRKRQPLIENLEIILYAALVFLAWFFYPQPPA